MDPELENWLRKVDLQTFNEQFVKEGCSKLEHLVDVKEEDLKIMGLSNLQIRRFFRERAVVLPSLQPELPRVTTKSTERLTVHMPSPVFGHKVKDVSKEELIREYEELYYKVPQNYKQHECNSFVLKMLKAAEWRFSTKRSLMDWGRKERDLRWNTILSFSSLNDVSGETKYFQQQCINFKLAEVMKKFNHGLKGDRKEYLDQLSELLRWAEAGEKKIESHIEQYAAKPTCYKEESDFWGGMKCKAEAAVRKIQKLLDETPAPERATVASQDRKKRKNTKKEMKRKAVRAQSSMLKTTAKRSRIESAFAANADSIGATATTTSTIVCAERCAYPL